MKSERRKDILYYQRLYETCEVLPERVSALRQAAAKVLTHIGTYQKIERDMKIPWVFVALIHCREASCDMNRQILNGELWKKRTRQVPAGIGPFISWISSTVYACKKNNWHKVQDWSIANMLKLLETHNGMGYLRRGQHSPYLWAGSNHGVGVGKFVADGKYEKDAVDQQIGAAVLLKELIQCGVWKPEEEEVTI